MQTDPISHSHLQCQGWEATELEDKDRLYPLSMGKI